MSVKQFSAVYCPIEDRIAFSFNTTEGELYSFILTRALSKSLLEQIELTVEQSFASQHNERSSKLLQEFQKDGLKKQINFEESFDGGATSPLGADPLLVSHVQLDLKPELVSISLTLVSNQVVGFSVLPVQLQALTLLIEKLARQAQWQIMADEPSAAEAVTVALVSPSSQLH